MSGSSLGLCILADVCWRYSRRAGQRLKTSNAPLKQGLRCQRGDDLAQIWRVRLGGVPLGVTAPSPHHVQAVGALTNGLAALVGATLMATKRRNAALVLAISMAVVGTAIGVAKAFGGAKPHQT